MTTNLTTYPWIPILRVDGGNETVSLEDVFGYACEIRDLSLRPYERIAVMRLLLCVAHAALDGPANRIEWQRCRGRIADAAVSYLEQWSEQFSINRFLQVDINPAGDETNTPLSKLDFALAAGNNPTLFDHAGGNNRAFSPAAIALSLLTHQNFSPGGTIGVGLWNGQPTLGLAKYPKPAPGQSNHAPCVSGSMLHTWLVGSNLLDTIRLNLLNQELVSQALGSDRWGRPIWEQMPTGPSDQLAVQNATHTYLGRLVPLSRAIRLNEDGLVRANGLNYPSYREGFREPFATIVVKASGEERTTLGASLDQATWRQLHALTVRRISQNGVSGPLALENLDGDETFDLWTGALIADKAKVIDTVESIFSHIPSALLTGAGQRIYQDGVKYAENAASRLWAAVREYREQMGEKLNRPENRDRANLMKTEAASSFWTDVEQGLPLLLALVKDPSELRSQGDYGATRWGKTVRAAMYRAYELACSRDTARQMQAYVAGLQQLTKVNK